MISVIIPTYNRANLISQTIESVLNQTYSDLEIIVVDDHSTDNTEDVVKDLLLIDKRIHFVKRPNGLIKGANSCRNFGFEISKGEFIKWIDSDDLLTEDTLERQLASLKASVYDLSICNTDSFNNDPNKDTHKWGNIDCNISVSNFILGNFRWHTGAGLWKKSFFSGISPWKEGLMNSQEWLMHLTQLVHNVNLVIVPQTLCLVRNHKGSMSHKSNKSAFYYYNELKARKFAFDLLYSNSVKLSPLGLRKLGRQFFVYHFFILYKLGLKDFLRGFIAYPALLKYLIFVKKYPKPFQAVLLG